MQQIAVETVGLQPLQRTLARGDGAAPRGVARQHLRDQENVVAPPGKRFGDHQFGIAIHLGGVDMGHAEIDATAQGGDRGSAIPAVDIPGALPDHWHKGTAFTKYLLLHDHTAIVAHTAVIPGWCEAPDLRCAIAHRGISRFRVRCFTSHRPGMT
jgi:hypothetical protein